MLHAMKTHKELRSLFYPTKSFVLVRPAPPKKDPEAPVVKEIKIEPINEVMDAEEFAKKMRRGEFVRSEANYRRLIGKLASEHGYTYEDMVGASRKQKLVEVRFYVAWYLVEKMKVSNAQAGRMLHKDHTSILHGVTRWKEIVAAGKAK